MAFNPADYERDSKPERRVVPPGKHRVTIQSVNYDASKGTIEFTYEIASADDDGNNTGRPSAPPPPRSSSPPPPPAPMTTPPSTWSDVDAQAVGDALSDLGYTLAEVDALCLSIKRPLVSDMTAPQRAKLLLWLCTDDGAKALKTANNKD